MAPSASSFAVQAGRPVDGGWAAASWSGGKDGTLALIEARAAGWDVRVLLTGWRPAGPHPLPRRWFEQAAWLWGCRWCGFDPGTDWGAAFDAELAALRAAGCAAVVFGDIDLHAHRDWLEPRVRRAGLQPLWPLWRRPRAAVAQAVLAAGIEAVVLTVDARRLDPSFCGRRYDAAFLAALPPGVCPCGEDGEFHTAVVHAPGMAGRADLQWHGVREIRGPAGHWWQLDRPALMGEAAGAQHD